MTENTNNNEWRSKKEIAAHFGIGLRTVTDWMRRRIMPFVKVGGVVRFCVPDCEAAVRKYLRRTSRKPCDSGSLKTVCVFGGESKRTAPTGWSPSSD